MEKFRFCIFFSDLKGPAKRIYRRRSYITKKKNDRLTQKKKIDTSISKVHLANHHFVPFNQIVNCVAGWILGRWCFSSLKRIISSDMIWGLLYETHQPFLFRILFIWPPKESEGTPSIECRFVAVRTLSGQDTSAESLVTPQMEFT